MVDYKVPVAPGMVVLDAVHAVQAMHSPDLAVRWNCKAGKCGSCSGEVNGKPRLMCMDRMDKYPAGEPIVIRPMKTFPVMKDLVCDVSWNYSVNKKIPPFKMRQTKGEPQVLAGRSGSRAGVSQVHRVLLVPERVPRAARSPEATGVRRPAVLCARGRVSKCTRSIRATGWSL